MTDTEPTGPPAYAGLVPRDALVRVADVLAAGLVELGADGGFVASLPVAGDTIYAMRIAPAASAPEQLTFPANAPYPLAAAARRNEEIFITSNNALLCDHPGLERVRPDDHACATAALHDGTGAVVGAVNVSFKQPREFFSADDRDAVKALFAACESALGR